ncbi:putative regulator [Klebsiella pneumoniae]|uniref:Putative regulator n=1 Tax=Klebsiella pneumoniae TaxID=573 RepID=A0A447RWI5_KLEPN|nr:putative regulator [Klebsiella pneumoniae]
MKSVTIAIRNRDHRVIGLLCINMNLDVPFSQIMSTFIPPETPEVKLAGELCFFGRRSGRPDAGVHH